MEDARSGSQTAAFAEVIVVCERQTESNFVKEILAPALGKQGGYLHPRLVSTSRSSRGGAPTRQRVLRLLRNALRERQDTYVTTFLDLYGLPGDFPGRSEAALHRNPLDCARIVEQALHAAVTRVVSCRPERFLPHVQPCEFEALLFSDVARFAEAAQAWRPLVPKLETARESSRSPEHIDDGPATHPSARLAQILRPRYKKVRHGSEVSKLIGLRRMRADCSHFSLWLRRLEALASLGRSRQGKAVMERLGRARATARSLLSS